MHRRIESYGKRPTLWAFCAVAALLVCAPLPAEEPPQPEPDSTSPQVPVSGLMATWDPTSKSFRAPDPDQAAFLGEELRKFIEEIHAKGLFAFAAEQETPPVETLEDGLQRAFLPLSMMKIATVKVLEDGSLGTVCHESPAEAKAHLTDKSKPTIVWEEQ